MAAPRLDALIGQIEKLSQDSCERAGTDRQLLEDFSTRRDEKAFAELVFRHGPLVLRVCRSVLHHEQDAEDAFQATFLVLAQSFGSIRKREALADWLHGVAYRTALKAKRSAARRRNHETQLRERTPPTEARPTWDDVQAVLDEEIQRLPVVYRSSFVLCVLEGKTIAAVAVELGCKEGTIATRVMRARQRLQRQLARRGIQLAALLAAVSVAEGVAKAVPTALAQTVIRHGLLVSANGSAATAIPTHVVALATGVTRAMFMQKIKSAVVVLLTLGLFAAGAGVLTHQLLKAEEKPSVVQPAVQPPAEPAKPAEDTVEVTGRVLDPDGKAVAKARLYQPRYFKDYSETPRDYDAVSLGVTDAEGRFQVKLVRPSPTAWGPVRFYLVAAADGFGLNWVELPKKGQPDEVTLRLVKDQVVRGRLVSTEGKPVIGVTVNVHGVWRLADYLPWIETFTGKTAAPPGLIPFHNKVVHVSPTDKDGRFEIAGLGAERCVSVNVQTATVAMPYSIIVTREGFDPKPLLAKVPTKPLWLLFGLFDIFILFLGLAIVPTKPLWLLFGPSFEWAVLPTRSLEGTVREAGSDKPVSGARVRASGGNVAAEAVTDAQGQYKLTGLIKADTYYVSVTPGNTVPLLRRSVKAADQPGLETITCNVELKRGALVTGRILDKATGKAVRSYVHWVPLPDNPFAKGTDVDTRNVQVLSELDGRFSLAALPGLGVVLAEVMYVASNGDGLGVNPYKLAEFDEADRKRVKVENAPESGGRHFLRGDGSKVLLNSYNACKVVDLKENGAPLTCDLDLAPGKKRTINLEDPDGKPLTGVAAAGLGAMPYSTALLKTATCPVFAFDAEQPRQLAFLHKERKLAALVTVRGDDKEPLTVRLAPGAVVTGRLLDPEGQPLAGAGVSLDYWPASNLVSQLYWLDGSSGVFTDKEGRFRLEAVFPGVKFRAQAFKVKVKGHEWYTAKTAEQEALQSGATLDLGDIRVKMQSE